MFRNRALVGRLISNVYNNIYKHLLSSKAECSVLSQAPQALVANRVSDIAAIEEHVTNEISTQDVNIVNVRAVSSVLLERGASVRELSKLFVQKPQLANVQCGHWERLVTLLDGFGLTLHESINIIRESPLLLGLSNERIAANLNCLQNAGVQKIFPHIAKFPEVLKLKPSEIEKRTKWLKTVFPNKDVETIVTECPNVFSDTTHDLMMKVQYVHYRMNLDQSHVVKSNALAYSLQHIATRHEFLKRAGIYTMPTWKLNLSLYNNPSLKIIIQTSDRVFAEKIAKVNYEEYEFFKKLAEMDDFFKLEIDDTEPPNASYRR